MHDEMELTKCQRKNNIHRMLYIKGERSREGVAQAKGGTKTIGQVPTRSLEGKLQTFTKLSSAQQVTTNNKPTV